MNAQRTERSPFPLERSIQSPPSKWAPLGEEEDDEETEEEEGAGEEAATQLLDSQGINWSTGGLPQRRAPRRLPADPPPRLKLRVINTLKSEPRPPDYTRTSLTQRDKNSRRHQFQCQFVAHTSQTE